MCSTYTPAPFSGSTGTSAATAPSFDTEPRSWCAQGTRTDPPPTALLNSCSEPIPRLRASPNDAAASLPPCSNRQGRWGEALSLQKLLGTIIGQPKALAFLHGTRMNEFGILYCHMVEPPMVTFSNKAETFHMNRPMRGASKGMFMVVGGYF
jgi:hypothetical protein